MARATTTRQAAQAIDAKVLIDAKSSIDGLARDAKERGGLFLGQVAFNQGMNRANPYLILFDRAQRSGVRKFHGPLLPPPFQRDSHLLYRQTFTQWGSMVSTFPDARLHIVKGAKLFSHEERPQEVAQSLLPTLLGAR